MTADTNNADETFVVRGTSWTIFQDHATGFWGVADNLILQSEDFTTTWAVERTTVAADSVVAPDGTTTADTVTEDGSDDTHIVFQNMVSHTGPGPSSFSVNAKPNGRNHIQLILQEANNNFVSVTFDIANGAITQRNIASATIRTTGIEAKDNDFYRCTIIGDPGFGASQDFAVIALSDTATPSLTDLGRASYAGDSSSGVYLWGAQFSRRVSLNISYLPTTTAAITLPTGSEELIGKYTTRAELKDAIQRYGR